ncbi:MULTISPECIES: rod shape-determining protein MreC [Flavobacterium]|uniref:Cell shape-determining protein MreC n=1 Tax=Flavobacterium gawalongense TaxID=2594432 RepID=A0A553BUE3_9FLAO|nr:rod shape-determining protein MreC [Flavobacterium gawalongense]TRX02441.1 rod shape-determining protein MreC [Flavobacterium gawalongense]TRX07730.1 rod shape-determining protein MreC [Flavobacterium gawalongense]TRX11858.1 rod shape-determining protein MreC [Flavobacterium gawalongense]TRX13038.1 rod shape-determining protein MreC [Flavobacterium gawalongense]TRX30993.1 rod shape-determining protein MreC [Flavobacterium gawalongense]
MQQIFNFIFKNSNRLLFLLLLGISLLLTIQSHSFHRSKIISSANFLTGGVYEKINSVNEYLNLKTQNDALALENAALKSQLFNRKDTTAVPKLDSLKGVKAKDIIVSKVIHNSYNVHENYLTLNSGELQGVKTDMGVINSLGIVGIIDNTSPHYSTVISILNKKSQINAKIKKSNHFGSLIWNGKSTGFVQLIDVPRLAAIRKGDTIVTGGQSVIFPENINIGTISKIYTDNQTNYYTLDIKLFNDMTNLGHVYIIKSKDREELINLEKKEKDE